MPQIGKNTFCFLRKCSVEVEKLKVTRVLMKLFNGSSKTNKRRIGLKKAITVLWGIFAIAIIIFIISIFTMSTETTWRVFSITMPLAGIAFWGAVILLVIDFIRSKKG